MGIRSWLERARGQRMRPRFIRLKLHGMVTEDPWAKERIPRVKGLVIEATSKQEAEDIAQRFLEGSVSDIRREP